MTIPLGPASVRSLWPANPLSADRWSRSLWFERFADPRLKDDREDTPRRDFLEQGCTLRPTHQKPHAWLRFLRHDLRLPWTQLLFAQAQSRLLVNAGGGVLENAGLALDRLSGQPFIPGSAVKGCARRMAIEELLSLRQQLFPSVTAAAEIATSGAAVPLPAAADRVARLAEAVGVFFKVFGWGELDWQSRREFHPPERRSGENRADFRKRRREAWHKKRPDVAWAYGDSRWLLVRRTVSDQLAAWLKVQTSGARPLWRVVPNFAGVARFLPAYPVNVKLSDSALPTPEELGKLQLDLLASHHRDYYGEKPGYEEAPDTEDPNLVFFPGVAAGHVFAFTVLGREEALINAARDWLRQGLEVFGLGAKTAAGYGWFLEVSSSVAPILEREERLRPWIHRAEAFSALSDVDKELAALDFAAEPGLVGDLQERAGRASRRLLEFLRQREALLTEAGLSTLLKARGFAALDAAAQEDVGLELSDHANELRQAEPHFPHLVAPALTWLGENGLLPPAP